ncbi:hypothetical protein, partial [Bacteroides thetaiotaomicron]|uniref:hypothetical protein n=3 Tax=Bacteroides thetaiotaomicron TaxID=818 RepID=UPI001E285B47
VIYKEIGINIVFPTTSVFDHSSFPKEENGVTIVYYCLIHFPFGKKQTGNNQFSGLIPFSSPMIFASDDRNFCSS